MLLWGAPQPFAGAIADRFGAALVLSVGAVLYALPGGPLDACIAIRTVVLHEGVALLQAGAGIVADSDPTAEHEECLRKLAALETAIDVAEAG
jgi:anthranilate synthase component 1